ncbi:MAG: hypothetical protein DMG51_10310 [Acidobacteria bacterium]|nr:MAG: hypothetical protein DMG51_10310 [Acidobacteriota bacterium]
MGNPLFARNTPVTYQPLMIFVEAASGQVIVEDSVEHVSPIEQRRSVLEVGIEAGRVGAAVVLHAA